MAHGRRAFDNEMNIAVAATRRSYEGLMFREALKTGLYELQDARDRYRLACGPEGMRQDLMLRYVEVRRRSFKQLHLETWTSLGPATLATNMWRVVDQLGSRMPEQYCCSLPITCPALSS